MTEKTVNVSALVTGGSSGLGRATVEVLIQYNYKVIVFDLNLDAKNELEQSFGANNILFYQVDVTNEAQVQSALTNLPDAFANLRLCVNCAGIAPAKRTLNKENQAYALADFSKVININLVGSFCVAKEAAALMASNQPDHDGQRGCIINTASVAAFEGQIGQTAYAASKGGIAGLTLPMARDLAPLGIRVNTVAPGIMGTPMLLAMPENVQQGLTANVQNPKRLGYPSEFGRLVLHIAQNNYLNGETIRLDGGLRMPPK
ncbi:3-hydroxyacyl-CoA dehydrogenase [Glaciecola sp. 1036]|uniref:3-hydroxyacyl-CoA dehydrogenase n=1 Tax=Alteromonadaceae TaxID=72275 RepID=UPI003CFC4C9F